MLGYQFYHSTTKKLVIALGTLFNNIYINRVRNGVCDPDSSSATLILRPNQDKIIARDIGKTMMIKGRDCTFVTKIIDVLSVNQVVLERSPTFTDIGCEYTIVENTIKVPCAYSPREKFLSRYLEQKNFDDIKTQITLPRIGFELMDMRYDSSRMLNKINQYRQQNQCDPSETLSQFQRIPYNFNFQVYIQTKYLDDMYQILEQVLAFFSPDFVVTINDTSDMKIKTNVPFILDNVLPPEDTYEGAIEEQRYIISTLSITAKGYIYGPTRSSTRGLIRKAIIQFFDGNWDCNDLSDANKVSTMTVEPSKIEFETPVEFMNGEELLLYEDLNGNEATDNRRLTVVEVDEDSNSVLVKGTDIFLVGETLIGGTTGHVNKVKDFSEQVDIQLYQDDRE